MPTFHLHIRTACELIRDEEGFECPDLAAARLEAFSGARSLMSADVAEGFLDLDQAIELHDSAGRHIETVASRTH